MHAERSSPRLYVYALTDALPEGRFAAGARRLRAIEVSGVSAIVETIGEPRAANEDTLLEQHAVVVRLAQRFEALLPVRFGAVFTRAELQARIQKNHRVIRRALERVRGRVQMTVRLRGGGRTQLPRRASGTAWLTMRAERDRALRRNAARLRRATGPLVSDERIDPGKGDVQGTVYHLIRSNAVERYLRAISGAAAAVAPARLTVTGPWPAFAFVPDLDDAPYPRR